MIVTFAGTSQNSNTNNNKHLFVLRPIVQCSNSHIVTQAGTAQNGDNSNEHLSVFPLIYYIVDCHNSWYTQYCKMITTMNTVKAGGCSETQSNRRIHMTTVQTFTSSMVSVPVTSRV